MQQALSPNRQIKLSPYAKEFLPSFLIDTSSEVSDNETLALKNSLTGLTINNNIKYDNNDSVKKPKKSKEERGPRKRKKKNKLILNSIEDSDTHSGTDEKNSEFIEGLIWFYDDINNKSVELEIVQKNNDNNIENNNDTIDNTITTVANNSINNKSLAHLSEEEKHRYHWTKWAIAAAESERRRRIFINTILDDDERKERKLRQQWAIEAIERERDERISSHFLAALTSTHWFNTTISAYNEDYELVCPYYKLGCRLTCRRSTLTKHLQSCSFACEPVVKSSSIDDQEVICLFSTIGCNFIGNLEQVKAHLLDCPFKGKSQLEESNDERLRRKSKVIQVCEEERSRLVYLIKEKLEVALRTIDDDKSPDCVINDNALEKTLKFKESYDKINKLINNDNEDVVIFSKVYNPINQYIKRQMNKIKENIHNEAMQFWNNTKEKTLHIDNKINEYLKLIDNVIKQLWPNSYLVVYGSYVTGIRSINGSDIDVAVCFDDNHKLDSNNKSDNNNNNNNNSNTNMLTSQMPNQIALQILTDHLNNNAKHIINITKTIQHSRIPVIKANFNDCNNNDESFDWKALTLDISINNAAHTGLASTEFTNVIIEYFPPLVPSVLFIKEFLKSKELNSSFNGGICSYGLVILCTILFLKR